MSYKLELDFGMFVSKNLFLSYKERSRSRSYKTVLDFGRDNPLSYNRRNTVHVKCLAVLILYTKYILYHFKTLLTYVEDTKGAVFSTQLKIYCQRVCLYHPVVNIVIHCSCDVIM